MSHLTKFVLACHPDKSIHKRKTSKQHQISSIDQTGMNYTLVENKTNICSNPSRGFIVETRQIEINKDKQKAKKIN